MIFAFRDSLFYTSLLLLTATASAAERDLDIRSDAGAPIGACDLGATLNLPDHPLALVVFVHGSGSQNRDEGLPGGPAPFKDISQALSAQGIGSLRFDKRGSGSDKSCSLGMTDPNNPQRSHPELRPEHFIKDIENVYHRAKIEAPGLPIFLLGHSEGVNYVLELVAQKRLDPAGVILLAGLGRYPIDVTMLRQLREALPKIEDALKDPALTPEQRKELEKLRQQASDWLRDGEVFFRKVRSGQAGAGDYYVGAYADYWKEWIEITDRAAATAARAGKPSLLVQGSLDYNVAKDDFDALAAALKPAGGTSVYLKDLDHLFLKPGSDRVDASVPDAIAGWIKGRTGGAAPVGARSPVPFKGWEDDANKTRALQQLRSWSLAPTVRAF